MGFKKGQSGNPGGRPAKTAEEKDVAALARAHSPEAIERLVHWMRSDNAKASGSAAQAILNRAYGTPRQQVDAKVDGSLQIVVKQFTLDK